MKISDLWENYKDYSKALSDAARQLAFAGFAVVWIFKGNSLSPTHIPHQLVIATIFFIVTIVADYCQYAYGTLVYRCFARYRERKNIKQDIGLPSHIWVFAEMCLLVKTISNIVGYGYILAYVLLLA